MKVKTARGTNLEVALEVLLLHRVPARLALAEEPFAECSLLGSVDSRFGFGELRHGEWLA